MTSILAKCFSHFSFQRGSYYFLLLVLDPDPTGPTPLEWIGGNPAAGSLGNCQGDCDDDNTCSGDLICWQRVNGDTDPIPGCSGDLVAIDTANNDPGTDYCYDPTGPTPGI